MSVKLFVYDHLDEGGRPVHLAIELDEAEAEEWVHIDLEKRQEVDPNAVARTPQEIQDDFDKEMYNSDRKEFKHRTKFPELEDDEGNKIDVIDTIADSSWTPEQHAQYEDYKRIVRENLNEDMADAFICVGLENEEMREYAKRKGLTYDNVRQLLCRARKKAEKLFSN